MSQRLPAAIISSINHTLALYQEGLTLRYLPSQGPNHLGASKDTHSSLFLLWDNIIIIIRVQVSKSGRARGANTGTLSGPTRLQKSAQIGATL